MKNVSIEKDFATVCPALRIGVIEARVTNSESNPALWQLIGDEESRITAAYRLDEINKRPAIQATRKTYRAFGKDPNRYRVSSEALCRRIVKGMGIYRIDTLVDLGNLVSIRAGYSIGAFDADHIDGDTITLGVGREGELFHGIGRGGAQHRGAARLPRPHGRDRYPHQRRGANENLARHPPPADAHQRLRPRDAARRGYRLGGRTAATLRRSDRHHHNNRRGLAVRPLRAISE